jgi:mRNA interferase RelE/StbE
LKRKDPPVKGRILQKLREYPSAPLESARKLTDPRFGTCRYRVGSYRVVFDLEEDTVVVLRIGHRREIYL